MLCPHKPSFSPEERLNFDPRCWKSNGLEKSTQLPWFPHWLEQPLSVQLPTENSRCLLRIWFHIFSVLLYLCINLLCQKIQRKHWRHSVKMPKLSKATSLIQLTTKYSGIWKVNKNENGEGKQFYRVNLAKSISDRLPHARVSLVSLSSSGYRQNNEKSQKELHFALFLANACLVMLWHVIACGQDDDTYPSSDSKSHLEK